MEYGIDIIAKEPIEFDMSSISFTENASRMNPSNNNRPPPPPPPPRASEGGGAPNSTKQKPSGSEKNTNRPAKPPKPSTIKTKPVDEAISEIVQSSHGKSSSNPFADDEDMETAELGNASTHSVNTITSAPPPIPSSSTSLSASRAGTNASYTSVPSNSPTISEKDRGDAPRPSYVTGETEVVATAAGKKKHVDMTRRVITVGEPDNPIYHKIRFSESWLVAFLVLHIGQFSMLLVAAKSQLSALTMAILVIVVVSVVALVVAARWLVTKSRLSERRNIKLRGGVCTPEDEADIVPDRAVECLSAAAILEGIAYALYASLVAGNRAHLDSAGYYTLNTILQTIRFASITLLALHKIIRPANRIDPMRTIMEV